MQVQPSVYNAQQKLRDLKTLIERLERGQRMLQSEVERGNIAKCTDIIEHFISLNQKAVHTMEELVLIQQFALIGAKMFIRRDGKLTDASELIEGETLELSPHILLTLEKLKEVFGEVPHDILEIKS